MSLPISIEIITILDNTFKVDFRQISRKQQRGDLIKVASLFLALFEVYFW